MCRLTAYKGKSMLLGDLIVKPKNSLVCQSRDACFHPGVVDREHIRNIRVNGDGFGAAFYGQNPDLGACVFKFVTPAWSNKNLINLGNYVYSKLIMAHVRAASSGRDPFEECAVSIENCHPFKYGRWTFMHNGGIPRFHKVKRAILNELSEETFQGLTGSTDSEHIFALFLNYLPDRNAVSSLSDTTDAIEKTIGKILELCTKCGVCEPCSLNLVFTDGVHLYATRFRNGSDSPPTLYYNFGRDFNPESGCFHNSELKDASEIVVSSAPLSKQCGTDGKCGNWTLMPENHLLVCVGDDFDLSRVSKIYLRSINFEIVEEAVTCSPSRLRTSSAPRLKKSESQTSMIFDHSTDTDSVYGSPFPPDRPRVPSVSRYGYDESPGDTFAFPTEPPTWEEDMYSIAPYAGEQIRTAMAAPVMSNLFKSKRSSGGGSGKLSPCLEEPSLEADSRYSTSTKTSPMPSLMLPASVEYALAADKLSTQTPNETTRKSSCTPTASRSSSSSRSSSPTAESGRQIVEEVLVLDKGSATATTAWITFLLLIMGFLITNI